MTYEIEPAELGSPKQKLFEKNGGYHILLAEDCPHTQVLLSHVLENIGAEVTVVSDGQQCLERAMYFLEQGAPFDLILLDLGLPLSDGLLTAKRLRSRGYACPIAAISANSKPGIKERCLEAGFDVFIPKSSVHVSLVRTIVEKLLI